MTRSTPCPSPSPVIVWFRRDLRLRDNPALLAAAHAGRPVIPLFVWDQTPCLRPVGGAGLWWLDASLAALEAALEGLGSRLILRRGLAAEAIEDVRRLTGAEAVFWNRLYDPGLTDRDRDLKARLREEGVTVRTFKAALLLEPWELKTKTGDAYKVFTPFWRGARAAVHDLTLHPAPAALVPPTAWPASERRSSWRLSPTKPNWAAGFTVFTPGEAGAEAALGRFAREALDAYPEERNRPDHPGVSRLSPHLHWGEISPVRVWRRIQDAAAHRPGLEPGAERFLSELGWREFNHHLLFHRPDLPEANFHAAFDSFPWRDDSAALEAWRRGATGYPLVDAGMRELWSTGYMHNRVRMVAASFLIKHLLIDWREGERWFWDTLLDASPANNVLNWQWVAGSGADAAPFFRIFNPVTQGEKFDPHGAYVRRWIPALARLAPPHLHAPWTAPPAVLDAAGVRLGSTYPHPIVDHAAARRRALEAFKSLPRG